VRHGPGRVIPRIVRDKGFTRTDAAWAARADAADALTWEFWKVPGYLAAAARETGIALWDEAKAAFYLGEYVLYETEAFLAQMLADVAHLTADLLSAMARSAASAAAAAARWSAAARAKARALAAYAASQEAAARSYAAEAAHLAAAYAKQQARKAIALAKKVVKKIAKTVAKAAKTVVKTVARAAAATARYVAKHSQVITQVGLAVAGVVLTVANVAQLGLDPVTDTAEAAEEGAPAEEEPAPSCGGESFTASTKVLLASGIAVPISSLKPGEKVLPTSTATGKVPGRDHRRRPGPPRHQPLRP
jgi:hypothetical protein